MVAQARERYPKNKYSNLEFRCVSALDCATIDQKFDTILLINSITEIPDVSALLGALKPLCTPRTRVVHLTFNYRWEPLLKLGAKVGFNQAHPTQNWLSRHDFANFAKLQDYRLIKEGFE